MGLCTRNFVLAQTLSNCSVVVLICMHHFFSCYSVCWKMKVNVWSSQSQKKNKMFATNYFTPAEVSATTTSRPSTTTARPSSTPDRSSTSRRVNTKVPVCVLAIVNCCSRYDEVVRTPCFEKYNCNGAFFGKSPCSPDIKAAAFREVEKFSRRWLLQFKFFSLMLFKAEMYKMQILL